VAIRFLLFFYRLDFCFCWDRSKIPYSLCLLAVGLQISARPDPELSPASDIKPRGILPDKGFLQASNET